MGLGEGSPLRGTRRGVSASWTAARISKSGAECGHPPFTGDPQRVCVCARAYAVCDVCSLCVWACVCDCVKCVSVCVSHFSHSLGQKP